MVIGNMAHIVIRSNRQLKRQGKKCERIATRPTNHLRSVHRLDVGS